MGKPYNKIVMKMCVFITGTNAVGKSALAWEIINRFGGIESINNDVTYCKDGVICFAGSYGVTRFGGVDRIKNDKGASCTSRLAEVVEEGLKSCDTIICEGSFMNTFGLNLTNAMFKADKWLVVNLWADANTIYKRLIARTNGKGGKRGDGKFDFTKILTKQRQSMIAARKWQSIGVKVLQVNTAETPLEDEARMVLDEIERR